jgi:arginyl-tRNA--protein-N-Asp/Glu arginylyltransferase
MYFSLGKKIITDFTDKNIEDLYAQGFVFTRIGKGEMNQTRSLRIDLSTFELSSENKRVLNKTEEIKLTITPLPFTDYNWVIAKIGKDFYETKFGEKTFSANKIKELLTDKDKSNFNTLLIYKIADEIIGYCITYVGKNILHYSYPFYLLDTNNPNIGLGMMTKTIVWAKENHKKYIYLGSASRPTDTYKLQFNGLEWFDGENWSNNLVELKNVLKKL